MSRVDASIPLQARSFQLPDPVEQYGRFMQLQTAQHTADERARAENERTQAQQVFADRSATPDEIERRLLGISPAQSYAYGKNRRENEKLTNETRKARAAAEKDEFDTQMTRLNYGLQLLGASNDQQSWTHMRDEFVRINGPERADRIPLEFDPKQRDFMREQTLTQVQRLADLRKQQDQAQTVVRDTNTATHNNETRAETARSHRVNEGVAWTNANTSRGNLTVAQDRLKFEQANPTMQIVDTATGPLHVDPRARVPSRPVLDPQGKPLPVKPGSNNPSEDERRSAGLAVRMEGALRKVEEVTKEKPGAARPGWIERGLSAVNEDAANVWRSEARQRIDTAQLDALDAALTLATGAAYTREQLKGLSRSYFPQIGDDEKTVSDKKKRLEDVIQSARIRAGRSAGAINDVLNRSSNPALEDALQAYPE